MSESDSAGKARKQGNVMRGRAALAAALPRK